MPKGQSLHRIEHLYDTVAKEYAEAFFGEHEKKPKDREILLRFSQEIAAKALSGTLAAVPVRPQPT